MHSLDVIKTTCIEATEKSPEGDGWQIKYCSIVDPRTALEMAQRIEQLEKFEHAMSVDELQALGKLVRDLTGYIKLTAGDKSDAIRDDLLLQARQLLGLTGI